MFSEKGDALLNDGIFWSLMFVALGGMNLLTNIIQVSARFHTTFFIMSKVALSHTMCVAVFDCNQYLFPIGQFIEAGLHE